MPSSVTSTVKTQQPLTIPGANEATNIALLSALESFNENLLDLAHSRMLIKLLSSHVKVTLNDHNLTEKDKELALVNANDYISNLVDFLNEIQALCSMQNFSTGNDREAC
ncbi:hypothetical protein [uncultured Acetobacteroides sp.]|uniref:hypothetical protein n=1 Tax=uncultured Acetobacteroides sp. TaxID=1760811 RepID=UPI0029F4E6E2|nr:hypothetical protein [uncultured Acetobacteroides sp.]